MAFAGSSVEYRATLRGDVMVPMRDGTRLSLRLHFPDAVKHGPGPWPALFEQRYGNDGTDESLRKRILMLKEAKMWDPRD